MENMNPYAETKRLQNIDVLKGIAIILVVLGHVICDVYDNKTANENIVFKICYSFHMPLFIFLSGYLTGERIHRKGETSINGQWILKRAERLMIPSLVWTVISLLIHGNGRSLLTNLFVIPVYWFLINLFLYDLITFIAIKVQRKYFPSWLVNISLYTVFLFLYLIFRNNNLVIKNVVLYCFFYFIGLYWHEIRQFRLVKTGIRIKKLFLILYPVSMIFFTYKSYDKYGPIVASVLEIKNIKIIIAGMFFYNHIIAALLGIGFAWVIAEFIVKKARKLSHFISFIGMRTLEIYVMHEFLFCYSFGALADTIISMFTGLFIPIIISLFAENVRPVRFLLFGQ